MIDRLLLDTDTCIEIIRNNKRVVENFRRNNNEVCYLSHMTISELFFGAWNSPRPEYHLEKTQEFVAKFRTIPWSVNGCEIFGKMKATTRKRGDVIADSDLIIASIAVQENVMLISNNLKHFERLVSLGLHAQTWNDSLA